MKFFSESHNKHWKQYIYLWEIFEFNYRFNNDIQYIYCRRYISIQPDLDSSILHLVRRIKFTKCIAILLMDTASILNKYEIDKIA